MTEFDEYEQVAAGVVRVDFGALSDAELDHHVRLAYKAALVSFSENYDPNSHRARPAREILPEPSKLQQLPPAHLIHGLVPSLGDIQAELAVERRIVAIYKRDRAAMLPTQQNDRNRTLQAVQRIKKLEQLIKTHYQSAINARHS